MNIEVHRRKSSSLSTLSEVYVDGELVCFALEDPVREKPGVPVEEWKVKGETAIPAGRYLVKIQWSPRFTRMLPRLQEVPGFQGVLIHPGNYPRDTEGCILPGTQIAGDAVVESRVAFLELFQRIKDAEEGNEEVWLTIGPADSFQPAHGGSVQQA